MRMSWYLTFLYAACMTFYTGCQGQGSRNLGRLTWPWYQSCSPCICAMQRSDEIDLSHVKVANCTSEDFSSIPTHLPEDTEQLDLSSNKLTAIDSEELARYSKLKVLILENNQINVLRNDTFLNTPILQYLDLTGNHFVDMPWDLFSRLEYMSTLVGLNVENLPDKLFHGMAKLRTLEMISNAKTIPKNLFQKVFLSTVSLTLDRVESLPEKLFAWGNTTLSLIFIKSEHLKNVHEDLLDNLPLLHTVHINTPELVYLPEHFFHGSHVKKFVNNLDMESVFMFMKMLQNSRTLKEISITGVSNLHENIFQYLPYLESLTIRGVESLQNGIFKQLNTLKYLDLSHNSLSLIQDSWIRELTHLQSLNLSHNNFQSLHKNQIINVYALESIDISHNKLGKVHVKTFDSCRNSIEYIDLSHNLLSDLKGKVFYQMWSLKVLKLGYNSLSQMDSDIFQDLKNLKYLHLEHNRINMVHPNQFWTLQDLVYLNLSRNQLHDLPGSIFDGALSLQILDISGNVIGPMLPEVLSQHYWMTEVNMEGNPLHCDCGVAKLVLMHEVADTKVYGTCTTPEEFTDELLSNLTLKQVCPELPEIMPGLFGSEPNMTTGNNTFYSVFEWKNLNSSRASSPSKSSGNPLGMPEFNPEGISNAKYPNDQENGAINNAKHPPGTKNLGKGINGNPDKIPNSSQNNPQSGKALSKQGMSETPSQTILFWACLCLVVMAFITGTIITIIKGRGWLYERTYVVNKMPLCGVYSCKSV